MSKLSVKVRAQILVPIKNLDPYEVENLENLNTWHRYLDPFQCGRCDYKPEKPTHCKGCEFYQCHKFYERQVIKDKPYLLLRKGFLQTFKDLYGDDLIVKDLQTTHPMKEQRYQFDMSMLQPKQLESVNILVEKLLDGQSGGLKSPPRTGKTVQACAVCLTLKRKTIIITHQEDLLIGKGQLLSTFTEATSPNAPINPGRHFTNLHKFIAKGKTPIKYCRTLEDFLETDICLTTYQVFLHPRGKKILEKIKDKFGLLILDEYHRSAADGYSSVINQFTCPRLGLSATPQRKDGMHRVTNHTIGQVIHQTTIESLAPLVSVVKTGFASNKNYKNWVYMLRYLEAQDRRIETLLHYAYKDVKKRKRSILIPVAHHSMVDMLVENLNDRGIKAIGWDGRLKKKERHIPLQKSANREVDVIVAQRSMLTGINIPVWDMMYWFVPMNNDPNFEQEFKRICTPMPNKPQPVVRFFVDDFEIVQRCFFNCANVIHKFGGAFTPSALEYWVSMGIKFNKITPAKSARILGKDTTRSKPKSKPEKPVNGLFDNHDLELVDDDDPKPKKSTKTPKKTSHLSRTL